MPDRSLPSQAESELAEDAGIVRVAGNCAQERPCMACGKPFLSEGWHNRLCDRCRKRSEPDS